MALIYDAARHPRAVLRHAQDSERCFVVTVGRTPKREHSFHVHYYLRKDNDDKEGLSVRKYPRYVGYKMKPSLVKRYFLESNPICTWIFGA